MVSGDTNSDLEGSTTLSEAAELKNQEAWEAGIAYMKYMDPIFTNLATAISKLTSIQEPFTFLVMASVAPYFQVVFLPGIYTSKFAMLSSN